MFCQTSFHAAHYIFPFSPCTIKPNVYKKDYPQIKRKCFFIDRILASFFSRVSHIVFFNHLAM